MLRMSRKDYHTSRSTLRSIDVGDTEDVPANILNYNPQQPDRSKKLSKPKRRQKYPADSSQPVIEFKDAKDSIIKRAHRVTILPRNTKQEEYVEMLADPRKRVVFAMGPAGTGKTLLATMQAIKAYKEGEINRIIISRPAVAADEEHGFLPGDLNKKMEPWVRPLMDVFEEYYSPEEIASMLTQRIIEIAPLAYLRGRTFKNTIVILDEAQLTTENQMKMVLTRIGDGTRMFITGDLTQTERKIKTNGLGDFVNKLKGLKSSMISVIEFDHSHIERDPVVGEILKIYGDE